MRGNPMRHHRSLPSVLLRVLWLSAALLGLSLGAGCATAPPAGRNLHATAPGSPHPHAIWVKGHFAYQTGRYIWVPGHWRY